MHLSPYIANPILHVTNSVSVVYGKIKAVGLLQSTLSHKWVSKLIVGGSTSSIESHINMNAKFTSRGKQAQTRKPTRTENETRTQETALVECHSWQEHRTYAEKAWSQRVHVWSIEEVQRIFRLQLGVRGFPDGMSCHWELPLMAGLRKLLKFYSLWF